MSVSSSRSPSSFATTVSETSMDFPSTLSSENSDSEAESDNSEASHSDDELSSSILYNTANYGNLSTADLSVLHNILLKLTKHLKEPVEPTGTRTIDGFPFVFFDHKTDYTNYTKVWARERCQQVLEERKRKEEESQQTNGDSPLNRKSTRIASKLVQGSKRKKTETEPQIETTATPPKSKPSFVPRKKATKLPKSSLRKKKTLQPFKEQFLYSFDFLDDDDALWNKPGPASKLNSSVIRKPNSSTASFSHSRESQSQTEPLSHTELLPSQTPPSPEAETESSFDDFESDSEVPDDEITATSNQIIKITQKLLAKCHRSHRLRNYEKSQRRNRSPLVPIDSARTAGFHAQFPPTRAFNSVQLPPEIPTLIESSQLEPQTQTNRPVQSLPRLSLTLLKRAPSTNGSFTNGSANQWTISTVEAGSLESLLRDPPNSARKLAPFTREFQQTQALDSLRSIPALKHFSEPLVCHIPKVQPPISRRNPVGFASPLLASQAPDSILQRLLLQSAPTTHYE